MNMIPCAGDLNPNPGVCAHISAIIYDKEGEPICFRCRTRLIDLETNKGRLDLGLHDYHCPHCDDRVCHFCGGSLVYSSTLDEFCCLNKRCPDYWFDKNR